MGRPCRPRVVRDEEGGLGELRLMMDGGVCRGWGALGRSVSYGRTLAGLGHGHCVTSSEIICYEKTFLFLLADASVWLIHLIPFHISTL